GIKSGNIIAIPLVKAKCAIAVNASIADIAICPDNASSKFPRTNFVVKSEIANTEGKTINGFNFFVTKVNRNKKRSNELGLINAFSYSTQCLWCNANIGSDVF